MRADILPLNQLDGNDRALWLELCRRTPEFGSPLLGPDFAEAVARHRADVRVAVFRQGSLTLGFFAHHRRGDRLARPIGAPFSDYHALVTAPGLPFSGPDLLAAAGVRAFPFSALLDPHGLFDGAEAGQGLVVRSDGDPEAQLERIRAASPKKFKNYRRLAKRLDDAAGPLALRAPDHRRDAFDQLLSWKRRQFEDTGLHDVFRPAWSRGLMEDLFLQREGAFRSLLITLWAGEELVAGHFGVRLGAAYHPWIAATSPRFAAYSPGHAFMTRAIAAMPELGLETYDLSAGHEHYKAAYAQDRTTIVSGRGLPASRGAPRAGALELLLSRLPERPRGLARRAGRRLDHIASVELTAAGRLRGLVSALQGSRKRLAAAGDAP